MFKELNRRVNWNLAARIGTAMATSTDSFVTAYANSDRIHSAGNVGIERTSAIHTFAEMPLTS